jgi:hypothetical protein
MTCTSAMILAMLTITALRPGGSGREARGTPAKAEGLIARALELRRAGHPSDALELFRQAHDQSPSPRTLGHMGLVETSLQLWSDADAHLAAALATPGDQWVRQNQAFLAEAQARANMHVGELAVTGPPGTHLSIAGRELGRLPLRAPLRLAEGDVRITATSDGHEPFSVEVNIQGGRRAAVTVLLDPVEGVTPLPPAAPPPPPADAGWHLDRRKWLGGGLAVAGAGVLTLGIGWLQVDGRCETWNASSARCLQAYRTSGLGWLATGTGAALLGAGGVVLVLASRPGASMGIAATPRSIRLEARF